MFHTLRNALSQPATRQFEAILEEYRRCSKQWSATLHKFAEGACTHCAITLVVGHCCMRLVRLTALKALTPWRVLSPRLLRAVRMRGRKRSMVG